MSVFEVTTVIEPDRRICEAEEAKLTGTSRAHRYRLAKEGKYPPKGKYGPLLSEVVAWVNDPENYRYNGDQVVTQRNGDNSVKVHNVKRRAVSRRQRTNEERSV